MAAGEAAVAKLMRSGLQVPHYWIPSIFMQYLHSSGASIPFVISCLPFAAKRCRLWGDLGLLRSDATCQLAGFADPM